MTDKRFEAMRSGLLALAADCHRSKWAFNLGDEEDPFLPRPSKAELTVLVEKAFNLLHGLGDRAKAILDEADRAVLVVCPKCHHDARMHRKTNVVGRDVWACHHADHGCDAPPCNSDPSLPWCEPADG